MDLKKYFEDVDTIKAIQGEKEALKYKTKNRSNLDYEHMTDSETLECICKYLLGSRQSNAEAFKNIVELYKSKRV